MEPTPETIATAIRIAPPSIRAKQIIINFIYQRWGRGRAAIVTDLLKQERSAPADFQRTRRNVKCIEDLPRPYSPLSAVNKFNAIDTIAAHIRMISIVSVI